jgi:hypothetical protein
MGLLSLVAFFYGNRFFLWKMGHLETSMASYMHIKSLTSFAYYSFLLIAIHPMEKACPVKVFSCVSLQVQNDKKDTIDKNCIT